MRATPTQAKPRAPAVSGLGRGAVGQAQIADKSGRITEYWSEDDKCPICKTDRYLSPRLRLMVSPCYHKMCESCIDRLFSLGPAACPVCGKIVRKQQFSAQTFQDLGVEEEVAIRRRVAKLFNRRPEDFPSLKAYNDYLEEFEEITFNLVNKVDVEHTQQRLAQYEARNKAVIAAHQQQREHESEQQLQADEEARHERQVRAQRVLAEQKLEQEQREEDEREMVAALATGRSIEDVMRDRAKRLEARARDAQKRERAEQQRLQEYERERQARRNAAPKPRQTAAEAEVRPPLGSSGTVPRRRTQRNKVSDAQVMARLQAVCMPGNPTRMFKDLVKIGQGASGGVFTAKSIGSEQLVAIKQMVLEQQPKKDLIVNEIEVMKQSRHPNIVNFLNAFLNDGELWVVMEYMEGGPLTDVVLNSILSEAQIAAVTKECLTGLHHLHTHGVIHRDIKSDNVLMSMNGNIKLSTSPPLTQPTLASVHRSARRTPSASPWSARRTGWRPRWSHGKSTAHASTSGAWAFCASRWSKASRRT